MFMVPASNTMQTAKAHRCKNGTAKVEADLLDASEVTKTAELKGSGEENGLCGRNTKLRLKKIRRHDGYGYHETGWKEQGEIS